MTKADLVRQIAKEVVISRTEASTALYRMLEAITEALHRGEDIHIDDFCAFVIRRRKGRMGRHPRRGEPIKIPPSNLPEFKPSKMLSETVSG